jgi:hypothetical protein
MNKLFTKRLLTLVISASLFTSVTYSQFDKLDFLKSSTADGIKFLEAYMTPWINAFGAGLNGSWYNTAKPHKLGGFDITTALNVGFVPVSAETFDLSTLGLSSNISPTTGTAPTIAGPDESGPLMSYSVSGYELASFRTPPGVAWRYIPVPTAQIGVGLPLGTEVKVRFIPRLTFDNDLIHGDIGLWGIGVMHSIMQYVPGSDLLPVDASVFAGYTKLTGNIPIDLQPGSPQNYTTYNIASFEDQNLAATVTALNISAIGSVNLAIITFYAGLGYSKTSTVLQLEGNYPSPVLDVTDVVYNDSGVKTGDDFGEINIENFSGLRANVGLRFKFAVLTIHADYTRAQYNVVSAGLGISFR